MNYNKRTNTYSDYIFKLRDLLESLDVIVDLFSNKLPDDIAGRCDYENSLISINESRAKDALLTLAHEGGHWIHYLRNKHKEQSEYTRVDREKAAYLFGYYLLLEVGFKVDKVEWRKHNQDEWLIYNK